jgi:hypothetical protein
MTKVKPLSDCRPGLLFSAAATLSVACPLLLAPPVHAAEIPLASATVPDGGVPDGCQPGITGTGGPVRWETRTAPGGAGRTVLETSRGPEEERYPICIVERTRASDLDLSVPFTALSGSNDQAAGLVLRFKSDKEYYVVRANALEGNVRLYKVLNGIRLQIAGAPANVLANVPHRLRIRVVSTRFSTFLDDTFLFDAEDNSITGSGAVGVWTKSDSVTAFGALEMIVLKN